METKEQLRANLAQFDAIMAEAVAYFRELDEEPSAPGSSFEEESNWGAREVLAHLLFWHELHCQMLEDLLAGKSISMLTRPLEEVNAAAVAKQRGKPISAMVEELLTFQPRLRLDFEALSDPTVMVKMRRDGPELPAVERARFLGQHVKDHLAALRSAGAS